MKGLNKKQRKEYEEFTNEQFRILRGHQDRCMLRCLNKLHSLYAKESNGGKK